MKENQIKISESDLKRQGYNWLNTINLAMIKSLTFSLACIIIIVFTILNPTFTIESYFIEMFATLCDGFALVLFLASTEVYINAKSYDISNVSKDQQLLIKKENKMNDIDWDDLQYSQLIICKKKVKHAYIIYRIGLLLFFIGLFFILPFPGYNFLVFFAGIGLILWLTIK